MPILCKLFSSIISTTNDENNWKRSDVLWSVIYRPIIGLIISVLQALASPAKVKDDQTEMCLVRNPKAKQKILDFVLSIDHVRVRPYAGTNPGVQFDSLLPLSLICRRRDKKVAYSHAVDQQENEKHRQSEKQKETWIARDNRVVA